MWYSKEVTESIGETTRSLCATLSTEQQELFAKLKDSYLIEAEIEHTAIFECGFKLGARIVLEILANE